MNINNPPKISVLLPVYNAEKYIEQAIQSILNQTFSDFELIIINDGSTDNSLDIIKTIIDRRIVIIDQKNMGLITSLNNGIKISKGEFVARMDADDVALPHRFKEQLKLFSENVNLGLCGSSTENFGAVSSRTIRSGNDQFLKSYLLFGPPFAHPSIMMKRSILIKNNITYNSNFIHCEDFAMWSDMANYCDFSNVVDVLVKYRVHPEQVTNQYSSVVLDAHYKICCNNLKSLSIKLPKKDFLAYIAKQKHTSGFKGILDVYLRIISSNNIIMEYNNEKLEQVILIKIKDQLSNFYGLTGLLYLIIYHFTIFKKLPFYPILASSIKRTTVTLYKKYLKR